MRDSAPLLKPINMSAMGAAELEPWRFEFYALLRHIEARNPHRPRLGSAPRPSEEPVRLGQAPELSFAPAPIAQVLPAQQGRPPRINVRFFGLFGPNGPLPTHLTSYARERLQSHDDPTFSRFADVFHHRLLLLFYKAWAQAQPTVSADRPRDDRFAAIVDALLGNARPRNDPGRQAPDDLLRHFAGHLSGAARSAEALAAVLGGWLALPVEVLQFQGMWLSLPAVERTRTGGGGVQAQLGAGAVLGRSVWDRQHGFGLRIGPLRLNTFESLLPCGDSLPAIASLVAFHVGDEFAWTMQLELACADVPTACLGRHGRLGWSTWIGHAPHRRNPRVTLHTAHSRQKDRPHG